MTTLMSLTLSFCPKMQAFRNHKKVGKTTIGLWVLCYAALAFITTTIQCFFVCFSFAVIVSFVSFSSVKATQKLVGMSSVYSNCLLEKRMHLGMHIPDLQRMGMLCACLQSEVGCTNHGEILHVSVIIGNMYVELVC